MAAVLASFRVQHTTYLAQDQVVELQQNLRVAMEMLSRDFRSAGYDPTGGAGAGTITATDIPNTQIVFTRDLDGSGGTYIDQSHSTENDPNEKISYRLNTAPPALGRAIGDSPVHQPVADNIVALELLYLLADGTTVLNPAAADLDNIRGVQISMLAQAAAADPGYNDNIEYETASGAIWGPFNDGFRRRMLIQTVMFRNLGL